MIASVTTWNLVNMLLHNIVTLGHYIGPYLSEYAQKNQKKVLVHTYPSGTTIINAFMANNSFSTTPKSILLRF
jgi:hypothetical protein